MKYFLFFLIIATLYSGCEKKSAGIEQIHIDTLASIPVVSIERVENDTSQDLVYLVQGLQPDFLNTYAGTVLGSKLSSDVTAFQIEGNFTNSGNREIIAFFEERSKVISGACCFIMDSSEEKVVDHYYIDFISLAFEQSDEEMTGLSEDLGKHIIWKNRVIGCFGDFNRNGKDEIYLFRLSGINFRPYFYEFNGKEFAEIIEFPMEIQTTIVDINKEEVVIAIMQKTSFRIDDPPFSWLPPETNLIEMTNSYIWNEAAKQYEVLSTETKLFHWNIDIEQLEEIVQ